MIHEPVLNLRDGVEGRDTANWWRELVLRANNNEMSVHLCWNDKGMDVQVACWDESFTIKLYSCSNDFSPRRIMKTRASCKRSTRLKIGLMDLFTADEVSLLQDSRSVFITSKWALQKKRLHLLPISVDHGLSAAESSVHYRVEGSFEVGRGWILPDSLTTPDQAGLLSRLEVEVEADVLIDKVMDVGNGLRILLSLTFDSNGPWWLSFLTRKERTGEERGIKEKREHYNWNTRAIATDHHIVEGSRFWRLILMHQASWRLLNTLGVGLFWEVIEPWYHTSQSASIATYARYRRKPGL